MCPLFILVLPLPGEPSLVPFSAAASLDGIFGDLHPAPTFLQELSGELALHSFSSLETISVSEATQHLCALS